jgi:hypothetical protein
MKPILILAAMCALLLPAGAVVAATATPEEAAAKALETFALMVDEKNYRMMGFERPGQLQEASLGEPIEEFMIPLDSLKNGTPGSDASQLLQPSGSLHYPVLVQNRVLSGVTIKSEGEGWKPSGFGGVGHVRELTRMRDRLAAEKRLERSELFEVGIPALELTFMGYKENGHLFLTPLGNAPKFGFKEGETLGAEKVLEAVAPAARQKAG